MARLIYILLYLLPAACGLDGYVNSVYFTNWGIYQPNYQPADLPAATLSHVYYAFANLRADGTVFSADSWADTEQHYPGDSWDEEGTNVYGCVKQLYLLKKRHRQLKTILSIGGWTWSSNFASAAATPASRERFAATAVALLQDWGLDGLDIDWEYPATASQATDLLLLLTTLRSHLDAASNPQNASSIPQHATSTTQHHHFSLSIAAPAGPAHYKLLPLAQLSAHLDHINLMAYDYAGDWSPLSAHAANLYQSAVTPNATPFDTHAAVADYLAAGVPAHKLVLGMPLYGRSFLNTRGLGLPYKGVGAGTWEAGLWDYKGLPKPGAAVHLDEAAQAFYSYDNASLELISYDTPQAVKTKVAYLKQRQLGGSMFWEASGDRTDSQSLIATSFQSLGALDSTPNCLDYPNSRYANMRKGMPGA